MLHPPTASLTCSQSTGSLFSSSLRLRVTSLCPLQSLFLILRSLAASGHFLFPVADRHQGKPTSSSWNSPSPRGSEDRAGQPERSKHSRRAVYRKWTASLLYSASIKGNSAENFLEGVMKLTHTHTHTHTHTLLPFHSLTQKHTARHKVHCTLCACTHTHTHTHSVWAHCLLQSLHWLWVWQWLKRKHTAQLHAHTEHLILLFKQLPHSCVNILTNQITNLATWGPRLAVRTWLHNLDQAQN